MNTYLEIWLVIKIKLVSSRFVYKKTSYVNLFSISALNNLRTYKNSFNYLPYYLLFQKQISTDNFLLREIFIFPLKISLQKI